MESLKLDKSVKRVITLKAPSAPGGAAEVVTLYKKAPGKASRPARKANRLVVKVASGEQAGLAEYLKRHHESNDKKKNGWIRDLRKNLGKARKVGRKAAKRTKV